MTRALPVVMRGLPGTVSHVWFNGVQIRDLRGNTWTATGTPTMVAKSPPSPAGATGFAAGSYFTTGVVSDVLDVAGDFSACFVFSLSSVAANNVLLSNKNAAGTTGWQVYVTTGSELVLAHSSASCFGAAPGNAKTTAINVACVGRSGTQTMAKMNGAAMGPVVAVQAADLNPATDTAPRLGVTVTGTAPLAGTLYEVWVSTVPPSDDLFTGIMARAKSQLGITAW